MLTGEPEDPDEIVEPEPPQTPHHTMHDQEVRDTEFEYSTRHPADWVLSGPLGPHGGGPGRRFPSWTWAEKYARDLHGERVLSRVPEAAAMGGNRWAFLIRGRR